MSRLSREQWAEAALAVLADRGPAAIAVEPLAASLGTTKGSFYWHFGSRDELVSAALELWEQRSTDDLIATVEASGGSPTERFSQLFGLVFGPAVSAVELALTGVLDEPVREVVDRVTRRRVEFVAALLREIGIDDAEALRRAVLAYSAFLGHLHLARHPALSPDPEAYAAGVIRLLTAP